MISPFPAFRAAVTAREGGAEDPSSWPFSDSPDYVGATTSHHVQIGYSRETDVYDDNESGVTVIVHGEVFDDLAMPARHLASRYTGDAARLAIGLNGAFVAWIMDRRRDRALVITDRINGRRLFRRDTRNGIVFATSLPAMAGDSVPIDPIGVAWYLANGVVNNGRSVYRGISVLERASVYSFDSNGEQRDDYWTIDFDAERSAASESELRTELAARVADAVRRRVEDKPDVFLSLSGGYDATSIAGALRYSVGYDRVRSFSYLMGNPEPGTDEDLARQTSLALGYDHRLVQAYDGDLVKHIRWNGRLGQGWANPCDELDAYANVATAFTDASRPIFFTGSEWFGDDCMGWAPLKLAAPQDVMQSAGIYDFSRVRWMEALLPANLYSVMSAGLENDYWAVWERCPFKDNMFDAKDFVYLDQRLVHHNMPWWLCYPGSYAPVRTPLLDRDILDFMVTVPTELRRDKKLWRRTAPEAFPQLFQSPRTRRGSYEFDLTREVIKHQDALRRMIVQNPSPLDDLLPVDVALTVLDMVSGQANAPLSGRTRVINAAKKMVPRQVKSRIRSYWTPSAFVPELAPAALLRRLLVLREAMRVPGELAADAENYTSADGTNR